MSDLNVLVGIDGYSPTYDPYGLWRTWGIGDVWLGPQHPGQGRHVPKVNDHVCDPVTFETWIVDSLDPVMMTPTLRSIKPSGFNYTLSDEDVLFGVGPGPDSQTYRAYLNDEVFPHSLAVDQQLRIYGTLASYAKIFKGSDTSEETGRIISKVYDASGNFISNSVPLELVALDSHVNYAVKSVKRCHVTEKMPNGERITVVIYADDGHVVSRRQLLVENTDLISDVHDGMKYITSIGLESIWLSRTETDTLEYKLNIPMDAFNLTGVVNYSNGDVLKLPVDGGKFSMLGLDGRLSSIPDQPADLVLRYQLSTNETSYASEGVNGRYLTRPYRVVTVNPDDSIAVKLFGYPEWISNAVGYRMRWWLLNVARNVYFEVTNHVRFAQNTGPFDPKLYGYIQRKTVMINLRDVSPSFIAFNHVQAVDIVLNHPPNSDRMPAWTVSTESSDFHPRFGNQVYGEIVGQQVNFAAQHENLESWLQAYYWETRPLVNQGHESAAPAPTHFVVQYGASVTEWPIDQWNNNLTIAPTLTAGSLASIRFIRKLPSGTLQLAYAAAMVKHIAI